MIYRMARPSRVNSHRCFWKLDAGFHFRAVFDAALGALFAQTHFRRRAEMNRILITAPACCPDAVGHAARPRSLMRSMFSAPDTFRRYNTLP